MNKHLIKWLLILVAICAILYLRKSPSSEESKILSVQTDNDFEDSEPSLKDQLTRIPVTPPPGGSYGNILVELLDHSRPEYSEADIRAYVEARSRSKQALMAAYALFPSKSPEAITYLQELLRRWPDDPAVLAAALTSLPRQDNSEIGELTATLRQLDPDNSLPDLLSAKEFLSENDFTSALASFRSMSEHSVKAYSSEFAGARKDFFEFLGYEKEFAAFVAVQKFGSPAVAPAMDISRMLWKALDQTEDENQRELIAALGVINGQQLDNYSTLAALAQLSREIKFLEEFSGESRSPYFGPEATIEDLINSAKSEYAKISEIERQKRALLMKADNKDLANTFTSKLISEGEVEAYQWLQNLP